MLIQEIKHEGFEQVVRCEDPKTGLKAIIGVHSTQLGVAVGGCRMWDYRSEDEALQDVLRLSRGMTYKSALAGLDWGGGKAVILGTRKTPELLESYAECVSKLQGRYITAKDVGIGSDDLKYMKKKTPYVVGIEGEAGSSGDPSPVTAWGVYQGLLACVEFGLGQKNLNGLTLALQGLGATSQYLIPYLKSEGVRVIGCDISPEAVQLAQERYGVEIVDPEHIYEVACDVFSPSALGASLNARTIPQLKCKIVAGAANNQLATPEDGERLRKRGILYAPDYAINSGGIINIYYEYGQPAGYLREKAFAHVARVRSLIYDILQRSHQEQVSTEVIADRIVEERLARHRETKTNWTH